MNNIYETLKEYLELQISKLKNDKNKNVLKLYEAIKLFLSTPRNELNLLDDSVHEIIRTEILKNDKSLINNYRLLCVYSRFIDNPYLDNDPQIITARKNYKVILERLTSLLRTLEIQAYKLRIKNEEAKALISVYENYLSLFNSDGITKSLETEELNAFFQFLRNSTLDREVVLELITEFSKFNITYQINKKRLRTGSRIREIEIRANEVSEELLTSNPLTTVTEQAEELSSPISQTLVTEVSEEVTDENLTEEEQNTLNKIKVIVSELNGVIGDAFLFELLVGNFSINGRTEIYEAAGRDKWKLIYDDITKNLLPNFKKNKDSIFEIFEYIINIYIGRHEDKQSQQSLDILYSDIVVLEDVRINKYLELSQRSRFTYESYGESQRHIIDIAYSYLQQGDEIGLNSVRSDIPLTDIIFIKDLEKFKSLIKDWQLLKQLSSEEIVSYGVEYYKENVQETKDNIISILNKLDKDYEEIKNNISVNAPEKIEADSNAPENYVIFLNDENDVPLIYSTIDNMSANENLMDVYRSINNMSNVNYVEFIENFKTSIIKPDREPQMRKVRRGESRIAFIQVPISSENRLSIGKEFKNNKRFNVILVVNFGFKYNDSRNQSVYNEFNRIYDINKKQIMQIFNLFSTDFDERSFEKAQKMLLNGVETIKQIGKKAMNKEQKGV